MPERMFVTFNVAQKNRRSEKETRKYDSPETKKNSYKYLYTNKFFLNIKRLVI